MGILVGGEKGCLPLRVCTPRARINTGDVRGVFPGRRNFLSSSSKHIALWLVLALVFVVIFSVFNKQYRREPEIIFSEFMSGVERGDVQEVVIKDIIFRANTRTVNSSELLSRMIRSW